MQQAGSVGLARNSSCFGRNSIEIILMISGYFYNEFFDWPQTGHFGTPRDFCG